MEKTFGAYLFDYYHQLGVEHAFGIPGDYALPLFKCLEESEIRLITMAHEPSIGFSADAYARVHGLGLACVTYCVGGLNMVNSIACAYAEKSPVIVLSGAPSVEDRYHDKLLHHKVKTFATQHRIYEEITCCATIIESIDDAVAEVERVTQAVMFHSLPGYIEIPFDLMDAKIPKYIRHAKSHLELEKNDELGLKVSVNEAIKELEQAKQPVIIVDVEVQRYGVINLVEQLIEKLKIPVACTIQAKSVIRENHPNYIGVYSGGLSEQACQQYIDQSDCILMLGTNISDVFLGMYTSRIRRENVVFASHERVQIGLHNYEGIDFCKFLQALVDAEISVNANIKNPNPFHQLDVIPEKDYDKPISAEDIFHELGLHLKENALVVADTGDSLFGSVNLRTKDSKTFISDAFYTSMGFAVPAAIGAIMGDKYSKAYVLVGDGAFQMTGMELTTAAKYNLDLVVIIINNAGFGTQRMIIDGDFNKIHNWDYAKVCDLLDYGKAKQVKKIGEFEAALNEAEQIKGLYLIEVVIPPESCSQSLQSLSQTLKEIRSGSAVVTNCSDLRMQ